MWDCRGHNYPMSQARSLPGGIRCKSALVNGLVHQPGAAPVGKILMEDMDGHPGEGEDFTVRGNSR